MTLLDHLGQRVSDRHAPARSIVVAQRLPARPKRPTGNPFTSDGDIVAECQTCFDAGGKRCHFAGPRADVKKALAEHHRMYHPEQTGVILLNAPNQ